MRTTTEIIASRKTFDGVRLEFTADGEICSPMRVLAWGLGREALLLVAEDVCLYDYAEVAALAKAAKWAVKRGGDALTGMREKFAGKVTPRRRGGFAACMTIEASQARDVATHLRLGGFRLGA